MRSTTKKMMVTKAGGSMVGDQKVKKFLKEDKSLRRIAYQDKAATLEAWKSRKYFKNVKEKIGGSSEYRETVYGKKTSSAKAFRDTVREEVRQDAPKEHPPTKEELDRQRRLDQGKSRLRQFEQTKQIEKETGRPLTGPPPDRPEPQSSAITGPPVKSSAGGGSAPLPKAVPLAGGGVIHGLTPPSKSTPAPAFTGGVNIQQTVPVNSLPPVFGLRGRVLRFDEAAIELFVRVLNAPTELAVFIGRDLTLKVPSPARCWKERHGISCSEIRAADHIDARGKILNEQFVVDELYVNEGDVPDFVVRLENAAPSPDLPPEVPDDLAI
ncbi:MAG: hypothetical protein HY420_02505 [Candidatus Kerfeldbacteria bacterium]|nr:hypothetical protein [Candidatus Kerfeldbacteria bacterium]